MEALTERLCLQHDLCRDTAHLVGRRCAFKQQHSLCALSASCAKLLCPPTRLSDRANCMAGLRSTLPLSRNSGASLTSALRLAAVSPLPIPLYMCWKCMARTMYCMQQVIPVVFRGSDGGLPLPQAGLVCMYAPLFGLSLPVAHLRRLASAHPLLAWYLTTCFQNAVVPETSVSFCAAHGQGL